MNPNDPMVYNKPIPGGGFYSGPQSGYATATPYTGPAPTNAQNATVPVVPTPQTPTTPTSTVQTPATSSGQGTTTPVAPSIGSPQYNNTPTVPSTTGPGMSDSSFLGLLNGLNNGLQQNNNLVDQKNQVLNKLFGNPVDPNVLKTLPDDIQQMINSGSRDQLLMQAQILTDAINGKNASVASSIQYLTSGWQTAQARYDTEAANLRLWSVSYGVAPGKLVQAVAPDLWSSMTPSQQAAFDQIGAPLVPGTVVSSPVIGPGAGNLTVTGGLPNSSASVNNFFGIQDPSTGKLVQYSTPTEGIQAGIQLIQNYQGGSITTPIPDGPNAGQTISSASTLEDMARVYAPTSDGNNPAQVAQTWADTLGVPVTTQIGSIDPISLASAVAQEETGAKISVNQDLNSMTTPSSTAPGPGSIWPSAPPDPSIANTTDVGIASGTGLPPSAVHQEAVTYGLTGKIPAIGLGSQPRPTAIRTAVQGVSGAIAQAAGVEEATIQQEWAVLKSAQQNSTKQYVQGTVNAKAAESYFATAQELAKTMDANSLQTAVPLYNDFLRTGEVKLTGDANVNNFLSALTEGMTEYAKVVGGQTSSAGVTNFSNIQSQGLLPPGVTADQLSSWVTNVSSPFMQKRLDAYKQGIGADVPQDVVDYLTVAAGGVPGDVTLTPQAGGDNTSSAPPGTAGATGGVNPNDPLNLGI